MTWVLSRGIVTGLVTAIGLQVPGLVDFSQARPPMTKFPDARPLIRVLKRTREFRHAEPLVLVNGLAEQGRVGLPIDRFWPAVFEVMVLQLLSYNGSSLHRHIDAGGDVTVEYLADRLAHYLDEFAPPPPYHLVGSSLGGQVVLTYAAQHPENVRRIVLITPSGLFGEERLPVVEGVRRGDAPVLSSRCFDIAGMPLVGWWMPWLRSSPIAAGRWACFALFEGRWGIR